MRSGPFIICSLLLVILACRRPDPIDNSQKLADSALKVHYDRVRKLRHYDTAGFEHKLLMAVYRRDSAFLTEYLKQDEETHNDRLISMFSDSSLNLPPLRSLQVDEAYRFVFESSFARSVNGSPLFNVVAATLTRGVTQVRLQIVHGYFEETEPGKSMKFRTTIRYRKDTLIADGQWKQILDGLDYCDFWGLKSTDDDYGSDGARLSVEGLRYGPQPAHYVCRSGGSFGALGAVYAMVYKVGGGWPYYLGASVSESEGAVR